MKSKILVTLVIFMFLFSACTPALTPAPNQPEVPQVATNIPAVAPTEVQPATAPLEPIKIGYYGPLTGPQSKAGQALMQGAQMKFDEVNANGGLLGRQIEFITCDDKSTPEEAVKCVQKLIAEDKVVVNVGSLHSAHLMATGPILEQYHVPTVAAGTSPTWCASGFNYLWRSTANADMNSIALADALLSTGWTKMAILYQNDDYGISGKEAIKEGLPFATAVDEEAYNLGDKDWSGQVIKMISAKPDFMVYWGLGEDEAAVINQLRAQGWTGPIVSSESGTYPDIPKIAGENVNGLIFASLYYIPVKASDYPDPLIMDFLQKYEKNFGALPEDDNSYRGYDAATVLVTGIEKAGDLDPVKIKDGINSISDLVGLAGTFDYAKGGCEGISTSRVWEYKDMKLVPFSVK